jgi:flagellar basal-body rod protein FlgC
LRNLCLVIALVALAVCNTIHLGCSSGTTVTGDPPDNRRIRVLPNGESDAEAATQFTIVGEIPFAACMKAKGLRVETDSHGRTSVRNGEGLEVQPVLCETLLVAGRRILVLCSNAVNLLTPGVKGKDLLIDDDGTARIVEDSESLLKHNQNTVNLEQLLVNLRSAAADYRLLLKLLGAIAPDCLVHDANLDVCSEMLACGLRNERLNMDIIVENLASMHKAGDAKRKIEPYRRKTVVFEVSSNYSQEPEIEGPPKVSVQEDMSDFPMDYSSDHPGANEDGYVLQSNVEPIVEMFNLLVDTRLYELLANATVLVESCRPGAKAAESRLAGLHEDIQQLMEHTTRWVDEIKKKDR